MKSMTKVTAILVAMLMASTVFAGDQTASFVESLYQRFAYRAPSEREMQYWSERVHSMTPELAEKHLKNFFFVHAAYKSICDRTVTIDDVSSMVEMLDNGQLTYQAVQWSLFQSDEYKQAKAAGRVGKMFETPAQRPL